MAELGVLGGDAKRGYPKGREETKGQLFNPEKKVP
jgi:hypothetical protein